MKIILFIVDVRWLGARVAPWVTPAMEWRLGVVVVTTSFTEASTQDSAKVQILLAVCRRFAMMGISGNGPCWK